MSRHDEYEVVMYPKLNHVRISMVHIVCRNQHVHRELEMGLVLDGCADVHVNNRLFTVRRGCLFFFNSNEPHEIIAHDRMGVKVVYIQLANNFCQDYLHLFRNLELLQNDLSDCVSPQENEELTELVLQAVENYMDDGELHTLHCMCSVCRLFSRLLSCVPYHQLDEAAYLARKKKTARLRRITEYVDSHYADRITLSELAENEGITVTYLSHFIHDNLDMTFQDYVNNVRFEKALKLIENSNMRLMDVSLESGFSDVKYLNKMFEKRFGCTPKEYRSALPTQPVQPVQQENQDFATEQIGRSWLADFASAREITKPQAK